jgi:hypothetical protein
VPGKAGKHRADRKMLPCALAAAAVAPMMAAVLLGSSAVRDVDSPDISYLVRPQQQDTGSGQSGDDQFPSANLTRPTTTATPPPPAPVVRPNPRAIVPGTQRKRKTWPIRRYRANPTSTGVSPVTERPGTTDTPRSGSPGPKLATSQTSNPTSPQPQLPQQVTTEQR